MNYSRFGAICELESAQSVAPRKPRCGATVFDLRTESRFLYIFDFRKSALNVLVYMKELQIST